MCTAARIDGEHLTSARRRRRSAEGGEARHRRLTRGRAVAVKVIDKSCIASQAEWGRFHTELQVLQRLRHPLVIELFEVVASENHFCIVQEKITVRYRGRSYPARLGRRVPELTRSRGRPGRRAL